MHSAEHTKTQFIVYVGESPSGKNYHLCLLCLAASITIIKVVQQYERTVVEKVAYLSILAVYNLCCFQLTKLGIIRLTVGCSYRNVSI